MLTVDQSVSGSFRNKSVISAIAAKAAWPDSDGIEDLWDEEESWVCCADTPVADERMIASATMYFMRAPFRNIIVVAINIFEFVI